MRTTKTDKIMSLFGKGEEKKSPETEKQVEIINPNLRIPEGEEIPIIFEKHTAGLQLVNVSFLLINEQLGQVMERFNCCMCEKCAAAVTLEALRHLPLVTVSVRRKSEAQKVNEAAAKYRSEAIKVLTKAVITVKNNPKH